MVQASVKPNPFGDIKPRDESAQRAISVAQEVGSAAVRSPKENVYQASCFGRTVTATRNGASVIDKGRTHTISPEASKKIFDLLEDKFQLHRAKEESRFNQLIESFSVDAKNLLQRVPLKRHSSNSMATSTRFTGDHISQADTITRVNESMFEGRIGKLSFTASHGHSGPRVAFSMTDGESLQQFYMQVTGKVAETLLAQLKHAPVLP